MRSKNSLRAHAATGCPERLPTHVRRPLGSALCSCCSAMACDKWCTLCVRVVPESHRSCQRKPAHPPGRLAAGSVGAEPDAVVKESGGERAKPEE